MADQILGMLPDLFLRPDGTRVKSADQWPDQRRVLMENIVEKEYGGMPPEPKQFRVEPLMLCGAGSVNAYRLHADGFTFCVKLYMPGKEAKAPYPVVLNGDGCWNYIASEYIAEANRRGMIVAQFNRTELAPDLYNEDRSSGIYPLYPQLHFGALSAWAWGYMRVMDALCQLEYVDQTRVAITGHSRGGKTVLLAGALDERFAFVNPNNSGSGGAGCYRYHTQLDEVPQGGDARSEALADSMRMIPYWFGPEMKPYADCEENLPFDQHFLKALVAPRFLLQTEALGDTWANPKGTWQTHLAAREAYRLLGVPEKIAVRYREGGHKHDFGAFCALLDLMEKGPAPEVNPFPEMGRIFDWKCPEE